MTTRAGSRRVDDVASVIATLRAEAATMVDELLQHNANHWESPSARDRHRIEEMARSIVDRLLSEPAQRAAEFSGEDDHTHAEALRELFGLPGGASPGPVLVPRSRVSRRQATPQSGQSSRRS
jgi:glutamyl-tRNA reductase